jgi:acyl carrier protein
VQDIKETVKQYILQEFLPGEDPANLTDSIPLVRSGILDSLATLKLVAFLESHYGIQLQAHEATPDNLNTIADVAAMVSRKRPQ